MTKIDLKAPIVPYLGLGGIQLYSTFDDLKELLKGENVRKRNLTRNSVRYDIGDSVMLFFLLKNKKLFKITTNQEYQGKLFGLISTKTKEDEIARLEPSFSYDDFEEVWESPKGVFIETDPETGTAAWISVFIRELSSAEFEKGKW